MLSMFGMEFSYLVVMWAIVLVFCVILEAITVSMTTLWFAIGAGCSLIAAIVGLGLVPQLFIFLIVSIILLCTTRKVLVDKLKVGNKKTDIDLVAGSVGIVINDIKPFENGRVKLNGVDWSAIGLNNEDIIEGSKVIVRKVDGAKLIVEKFEDTKGE